MNMAVDAAMLATGHTENLALWRFYGWEEPAVTFGYSQNWEWVHQQLGGFEGACIRRLTGGGIVDHRQDLTYALTIPPPHPLYRQPALDIYQTLHAGIAKILMNSGIRSELAPCPGPCAEKPSRPSGVCFQSPEPYDVIDPGSGAKLAGAAMKRNKEGVLIQGSLSPCGPDFPDAEFLAREFGSFLEAWLKTGPTMEADALPQEWVDREEARFSSPGWNFRR
jgi:lipoate-protein ligase A